MKTCPNTARWARWMFRPAVALLQRTAFSTKFVVLWMLSLVPIALTAHSLLTGYDQVVDPSLRELEGLPLVAPISRSIQAVQLHRGLTAVVWAGGDEFRAQRAAQEERVKEAFDAMAAALPSRLTASPTFTSLATRWDQLRAANGTPSPATSIAAHNVLVEQLQSFLEFVADDFLLAQDPDLSTYYLLDTAIKKLPHVIEHLGRLRAYCTSIAAASAIDDQMRFELRLLLAELDSTIDFATVSLAKATHTNEGLTAGLRAGFDRLLGATHTLREVITTELLAGRDVTSSAHELLDVATDAVDAGYALLHASLLPTITALITARIARAREAMWAKVTGASVIFLILLYGSGGIYFATMCTLRSLAEAARALAEGHLGTRVEVHARDELRWIGECFNTMATNVATMLETRREDEERLSATIETAMDAVVQIDAEGTIIGWNSQAEQTFGWTRAEAVGRRLSETVVPPQFREAHEAALKRSVATGANRLSNARIELQGLHRAGHQFPIELSVTAINSGGRREFSGFIRDITEQKEVEQRIWKHANFDPLTGLPNRYMFHDRLVNSVKKASRAGLKTGLLFVDLDKFKEVNDTLGHSVGDILLTAAAHRIRACVRESDTVARLGGDEFTVILADLEDTSCIERVAGAVLARLAEPFRLGEEVAYISASVGVTIHPDDAAVPEDLLKNADQAMYAAKNAGRGRVSYFTPSMQAAAQERMRLTAELRVALAGAQFALHYQPIVDLATGRFVKAEALIRWDHPTRGLVSPAEFIPVAEDTGMIIEIGAWAFNEAARQLARWNASHGAGLEVAVNVSPVQLGSLAGDSYRAFFAELEALGLPRHSIAIEITERLLMEADADAASKLREFRNAGVRVSIDDFGTGYSSLSYLQRFDIDVLKVDRSFVGALASYEGSRALTEAIIVMAHRLGLKVVAEGVETEEQRTILQEAGCDYAQGYLMARPMPAEAFEAFLWGPATAQPRLDPA